MEGQTETAFSNLLDAMQTAMRRRGSWIELRNREPLRLASDQTFDLFSGSGSLIIAPHVGSSLSSRLSSKAQSRFSRRARGFPWNCPG